MMAPTTTEKLVVLAVADQNQQVDLTNALSRLHGVANTRLLKSSEDWKLLPSTGLFWAFVDAKLVTPEIEPFIKSFQHVVLFNCEGNDKRVRGLFQPADREAPRPFIRREDFTITESLLHRKYGPLLTPAKAIQGATHTNRIASVVPGTCEPIISGPVVKSEGFERFLSSLRSGITEQYALLERNYVLTTSRVVVPPGQLLVNVPPCELERAESSLRLFATDPTASRTGCFLIGKKGVGKSTLAYYVGRTLNHQKRVCCIGIDYTFETEHAIQSRLTTLLSSLFANTPSLAGLHSQQQPHGTLTAVRELLRRIKADGAYSDISGVSPEAHALLESDSDRGFITHLYCYFEKGALPPEQYYLTHTDMSLLVSDAEHWYDSLKHDIKRLFTYYLLFLVDKHAADSIEHFSFRSMLRYMLATEEHSAVALEAFRVALPLALGGAHVNNDLVGLTSRRAVLIGKELLLPQLRVLVTRMMERIVGNTPLLLLLDNVDQRTSPYTEAISIYAALKLFDEHIASVFPSARAIIAMRDTTLHSQEWASISLDLTKGWRHIFVLPPDLTTVLTRRCTEWQRLSEDIGASGYREAMEVVKWVYLISENQGRAEERRQPSLIEIIEHRHPFNVREQLRTITQCCENVILHREFAKKELRPEVYKTEWTERSFEFFVRVFLLRDLRYFSEDYCELPNLFDNNQPRSPFNACLRAWALHAAEPDCTFKLMDLVSRFERANVPRDEIVSALDALVKYHILRREGDSLELGIWGEFFRREVAFDLPYISTVWWSTHILKEFSLGAARELRPSELRHFAGIFTRWVEYEEEMARSRLADRSGLALPNIYDTLSANVTWSLRNIERTI